MNTQDNINIDILNFFRFTNHGVDITHMTLDDSMEESLYNAVAFAQSNPSVYDTVQWISSPEWQQATMESVAEIIGVSPFANVDWCGVVFN